MQTLGQRLAAHGLPIIGFLFFFFNAKALCRIKGLPNGIRGVRCLGSVNASGQPAQAGLGAQLQQPAVHGLGIQECLTTEI